MLGWLLAMNLVVPGAEPANPVPLFIGHGAATLTEAAPLQQLDEAWSVHFGGKTASRIDGADLLSLRRADHKLPAYPTAAQIIFTNGDRIQGTALELVRERLSFTPSFDKSKEFSLPLSALAVIWLEEPARIERCDLWLRRLLQQKRNNDFLWLRNGDVREGTLVGLDRDVLTLEVDRKPVKVERENVAVVALNTELARTVRVKGPYGHLVLTDGSRLSLVSGKADHRLFTAKTPFGASFAVPLDQVAALDIYQGKAVYLSELKPKAYQHVSYFSTLSWPYSLDTSVAGQELRLLGNTYDKGLGMHSESRLTYALGAGYRRFEALVGLDDRTGAKGSVRIKVLVDGQERDTGGDRELTTQTGPRTLRIDVTGAKELTLVVEFGAGADIQDHVNWADARLVK